MTMTDNQLAMFEVPAAPVHHCTGQARCDCGRFKLTPEPPRSRSTDPDTSKAAAIAAGEHLHNHRTRALAAHYGAERIHMMFDGPVGMNDFELAKATNLQQSSIGCRRKDLERAGLVAAVFVDDKPLTRPSPSRTASQVYRITDEGRCAYEMIQ